MDLSGLTVEIFENQKNGKVLLVAINTWTQQTFQTGSYTPFPTPPTSSHLLVKITVQLQNCQSGFAWPCSAHHSAVFSASAGLYLLVCQSQ